MLVLLSGYTHEKTATSLFCKSRQVFVQSGESWRHLVCSVRAFGTAFCILYFFIPFGMRTLPTPYAAATWQHINLDFVLTYSASLRFDSHRFHLWQYANVVMSYVVMLTLSLCCFTDRCYIPLLRATDNTSQPIIGAPWSPESSESLSLIQRHTRSPKDPMMAVTAFAGPLSPSKASLKTTTTKNPAYQCLWRP